MNKIIAELLFFAVAAAIILPAPTLAYAWMTSKTLAEVMYR